VSTRSPVSPWRPNTVGTSARSQVSIATGRTDSVEAPLRLHHPDRGIVPTDELIRVVEPTGVMQQLTAHVVDRVVGQLAEWNNIGVCLRAAVNVSILDVITDDFDTQIGAALDHYGIDPEQLVIEITERSMTDDTRAFDKAAHRLTRVGAGLSLDDFGTGYASLRHLNRLPLTEVKIDRSYVSKIVQQ